MRLKSWASNLLLLLVAVVAIGIVTGAHVKTQAPFLVFGSSSGSSQVIKSTANALWVSLQGGTVTAPLLLPNGTAGAPSLTFTAAQNIGLFWLTSGYLGVSAGGVAIAAFANDGPALSERLVGTASLGWAPSTTLTAAADTTIARGGIGEITISSVAFSALGTPANGTFTYCTDCTETTPASCPVTQASCVCAGSGGGAFARRVNGVWYCTF